MMPATMFGILRNVCISSLDFPQHRYINVFQKLVTLINQVTLIMCSFVRNIKAQITALNEAITDF